MRSNIPVLFCLILGLWQYITRYSPFYLSDIVYKQVENDCCVGVYHGRQTLVKIRMIIERQDPKEEVPTPKLRSLMHFLENGRCVN